MQQIETFSMFNRSHSGKTNIFCILCMVCNISGKHHINTLLPPGLEKP